MLIIKKGLQYYSRTNRAGEALWTMDPLSACYFSPVFFSYVSCLAAHLKAEVLDPDNNWQPPSGYVLRMDINKFYPKTQKGD